MSRYRIILFCSSDSSPVPAEACGCEPSGEREGRAPSEATTTCSRAAVVSCSAMFFAISRPASAECTMNRKNHTNSVSSREAVVERVNNPSSTHTLNR